MSGIPTSVYSCCPSTWSPITRWSSWPRAQGGRLPAQGPRFRHRRVRGCRPPGGGRRLGARPRARHATRRPPPEARPARRPDARELEVLELMAEGGRTRRSASGCSSPREQSRSTPRASSGSSVSRLLRGPPARPRGARLPSLLNRFGLVKHGGASPTVRRLVATCPARARAATLQRQLSSKETDRVIHRNTGQSWRGGRETVSTRHCSGASRTNEESLCRKTGGCAITSISRSRAPSRWAKFKSPFVDAVSRLEEASS